MKINLPDSIVDQIRYGYEFGKKNTTVKIGGNCDQFFRARTHADLVVFLDSMRGNHDVSIFGNGSNIIVRDSGISGAVVVLGGDFLKVNFKEDYVEVGGGCPDNILWKKAKEQGVTGFEFLVGIPGTVGGAVKMNAGIPGFEIKDILVSAEILDRDGNIRTAICSELGFEYRTSNLVSTDIVLSAKFKLIHQRVEEISQFIAEREAHRRTKCPPITTQTAGSTFKNPKRIDGENEKKAWKLIHDAGLRGAYRPNGKVCMSAIHCNYLDIQPNCTATECVDFIEHVRSKVKEERGEQLELEVKIIG